MYVLGRDRLTANDDGLVIANPNPVLGASPGTYEVVFGQSAAPRPAVGKVQHALRALYASTNNEDYFPGPEDQAYGLNTHAAILRISRDFLEPAGRSDATCRSQCNTLASSAKSVCKDCLAAMLAAMAGTALPGLSLSSEEINSIADAYGEWLDAYIAKYGEHGEFDPAQIARREGVSLDEAARLAAERVGATTPAGDMVASGEIPAGGVQAAKFPWLAVLLATGVVGGTVVAGMYAEHKGKRGVTTPPVPRREVIHPVVRERIRPVVRERIRPIPWLSETPTRMGMPAQRSWTVTTPTRSSGFAPARRAAPKKRRAAAKPRRRSTRRVRAGR